jgi:hypothetical protein
MCVSNRGVSLLLRLQVTHVGMIQSINLPWATIQSNVGLPAKEAEANTPSFKGLFQVSKSF